MQSEGSSQKATIIGLKEVARGGPELKKKCKLALEVGKSQGNGLCISGHKRNTGYLTPWVSESETCVGTRNSRIIRQYTSVNVLKQQVAAYPVHDPDSLVPGALLSCAFSTQMLCLMMMVLSLSFLQKYYV